MARGFVRFFFFYFPVSACSAVGWWRFLFHVFLIGLENPNPNVVGFGFWVTGGRILKCVVISYSIQGTREKSNRCWGGYPGPRKL